MTKETISAACVAQVSIELAIGKVLDYAIPPSLQGKIQVGNLVHVPLRNQIVLGLVVKLLTESETGIKLRPIHKLSKRWPLLRDYQFALATWTSKNYCCSVGQVLPLFIPKLLRNEPSEKFVAFVKRAKSKEALRIHCISIRQKCPAQAKILDHLLKIKGEISSAQLIKECACSSSSLKSLVEQKWLSLIYKPKFSERNRNYTYIPSKPKTPNQEQQNAIQSIEQDILTKNAQTHLIFGVTGSGKTEVFLQCMQRALDLGRGIIYLVPEISLTPQTTDRVRARLGQYAIALWHSSISAREKWKIWSDLQEGKIQVVIGARSAIFCPMDNLGLIILDEEHDQSYKNHSTPYFHTRELAQERSKLQNCPLILASATPSLESYQRSCEKKFTLHKLSQKALNSSKVKVCTVNKPKGKMLIAPVVMQELKDAFLAGEQSILFLNRRGFFHYGQCTICKGLIKCPHCDLSLTWHQHDRHWHCHVCQLRATHLPLCVKCKQNALIRKSGCGTEQLEFYIRQNIPDARILRLDKDSGKNAEQVQHILTEFRTGKADILIGTQMVSKGHHFPTVTLCVIVDADAELASGDFRAGESLMQQLIQISGRAGRAFEQGKVWIQTELSELELMQDLIQQSYENFAQRELQERKQYQYPPFIHLIHCQISSHHSQDAYQGALSLHQKLQKALPNYNLLSAPGPSKRQVLCGLYRWSIVIKTPNRLATSQVLFDTLQSLKIPSTCQVHLDVDALNMQ